MELHGDGRQVRSFTYVTDTVDGFVRALDTPEAQGEILNIGSDEPITIVKLAAAVQEALGIAGPAAGQAAPVREDRRPLPGRALPHPGHREGRRGCSASTPA